MFPIHGQLTRELSNIAAETLIDDVSFILSFVLNPANGRSLLLLSIWQLVLNIKSLFSIYLN